MKNETDRSPSGTATLSPRGRGRFAPRSGPPDGDRSQPLSARGPRRRLSPFAAGCALLLAAALAAHGQSLGTTNLLEGLAAGTDSVALTAVPATTAWTATANSPWLHLSPAQQSGSGSATVGFTFDADPGAPRIGTLTIAGQTITVTQAAAVITVTSTSDSGANTLRAAVASAQPGAAIVFAPALTNGGPATITLTSGELFITNNLAIIGPGAASLSLSGNGTDRVFEFAGGATNFIEGISIIGGQAPGSPSVGYFDANVYPTDEYFISMGFDFRPDDAGGGIYNAGQLTLAGCVLSGNTAFAGGGIYNTGQLSLAGCTLGGNSAGNPGGYAGGGGGIYNDGQLTLSGCVLTGNQGVVPLYFPPTTGEWGNGNTVEGACGGGIYNAGQASLTGCTLSGNRGSDDFAGADDPFWSVGGSGGGIFNAGQLILTACTLSGNRGGDLGDAGGAGGCGGGIYNAGEASLTSCTLSGNRGGDSNLQSYTWYNNAYSDTGAYGGSGGGIFNAGQLILAACTLSGNRGGDVGDDGGAGGSGGGLYNAGNVYFAGEASLTNCTLSGNRGGDGTGYGPLALATGGYWVPDVYGGCGGGIYSGGELTLVSCTLNGNRGGGASVLGRYPYASSDYFLDWWGAGYPGSGGAICSVGDSSLTACTVSGNSAGLIYLALKHSPGFLASSGGGIWGDCSLASTLVALNTATNGPDLSGAVTSQGHNLVGQAGGGIGVTNGVDGDLVGTTAAPLDPLLGPLQANGGPTLTMALLENSPAIDAGDNAILYPPFNLSTDQRGFPRFQGARVDIGAYESAYGAAPAPPVPFWLAGPSPLASGACQLNFANRSGLSFTILSTTNVTTPLANATVLGAATENPPGSGQYQFIDIPATNSVQGFYRVCWP